MFEQFILQVRFILGYIDLNLSDRFPSGLWSCLTLAQNWGQLSVTSHLGVPCLLETAFSLEITLAGVKDSSSSTSKKQL
jgi:hypothetical protein